MGKERKKRKGYLFIYFKRDNILVLRVIRRFIPMGASG